MEWIVQLPLVSFSVIVHELSHGWTAFAKGDRTAERQGRLTLNPIPHIDPFGTIFLPLFCYALTLPMFGWAKPIPVDPRRIRRPWDRVQVAAAGPLSNLGLALAMAVLLKLAAVSGLFAPEFEKTVRDALLFGVSINLVLAFFNLLPVHPLDGSKVLSGLLPRRWSAVYERHFPYAFYVLLALLATRWLDPLVTGPAKLTLGLLAKAGLLL